jgi:hypothetical protein
MLIFESNKAMMVPTIPTITETMVITAMVITMGITDMVTMTMDTMKIHPHHPKNKRIVIW